MKNVMVLNIGGQNTVREKITNTGVVTTLRFTRQNVFETHPKANGLRPSCKHVYAEM